MKRQSKKYRLKSLRGESYGERAEEQSVGCKQGQKWEEAYKLGWGCAWEKDKSLKKTHVSTTLKRENP